VVSVARREYDSNQRHYNYPDGRLGGGSRFSAVIWVSFFLFKIKSLQCTCVLDNLLATGLDCILALVFRSNISLARNRCGDYTMIGYIISITWLTILGGYRPWLLGILNYEQSPVRKKGKIVLNQSLIYLDTLSPHTHSNIFVRPVSTR